MNREATGTLPSRKVWKLVLARTSSLLPHEGIHAILSVPRESGTGEYREDELSENDLAELYLVSGRLARNLAEELGRPGYYRREINGPTASSQDHFHIHIIVGKVGIKFRRSVDRITC